MPPTWSDPGVVVRAVTVDLNVADLRLDPNTLSGADPGRGPPKKRRAARVPWAADLNNREKPYDDAGGRNPKVRRRIAQARVMKIARQWLDPVGGHDRRE
jgi:hypothetical protein